MEDNLAAEKYTAFKKYNNDMEKKITEISVSDLNKLRVNGPARLDLLRELREPSRETA